MSLRLPFVLLVVPALALSGCALNDATGGGGFSIGAVSCGQESTGVTGRRMIIGVTSSGEVQSPQDLSGDVFIAYVPMPAGSGYTALQGQGRADGTFTIPEVPPGRYLLRWNDNYFDTECHELDLSARYNGNPEAYVVNPGSPVQLDVSGLTSWTAGDELQLVSGSLGLVEYDLNKRLSPAPIAGSTSVSGSFDYGALDVPWAVEEAQDVTLGQISETYEGAMRSWTLTQVVRATGFSIPGSQYLSGFAEPVKRDRTLELELRRGEFANARTSVSPMANHVADYVFIAGVVGTSRHTNYGRAADLLGVQLLPATGDEQLKLAWGNPYQGLEAVAQVQSLYEVSLAVPRSGGTVTSRGVLLVENTADALSGEVEPLVGPVTNPQVDAYPFSSSGSLSPYATTLSWSSPEVGQATAYSLWIYRVSAGALQAIAVVFTEQTSVVLPPILTSGESYHFRLRAEHAPRRRRTFRPFQNQYPVGSADALSGVFTLP